MSADVLSSFSSTFTVEATSTSTLTIPGATSPMTFGADVTTDVSFNLGDATGTDATGQCNAEYFDQRILAGGASEEIDLTLISAALYSQAANYFQPYGFSWIFGIMITPVANENDSLSSLGMSVGGALVDPWNGWLSAGGSETIDFGGTAYVKSSNVGRVVSVSNRYLKITNLDPANQLTYQILAVGLHN